MAQHTIYNTSTGEIEGFWEGPDDWPVHLDPGQATIPGRFDEKDFHVPGGVLTPKPVVAAPDTLTVGPQGAQIDVPAGSRVLVRDGRHTIEVLQPQAGKVTIPQVDLPEWFVEIHAPKMKPKRIACVRPQGDHAGGTRAALTLDQQIKASAGARINGVLKNPETQVNMLRERLRLMDLQQRGELSEEGEKRLELLRKGDDWVQSVVDTSRLLVAKGEADFRTARIWPRAPAGLRALADEL